MSYTPSQALAAALLSASRICANSFDAEDAASTAILKRLEARQFPHGVAPGARYAALEGVRRQSRRVVSSYDESPSRDLRTSDLQMDFSKAMLMFRASDRRALHLWLVEGDKEGAIASLRLGQMISQQGADRRLQRLRARLRESLSAWRVSR